MSANAKAGGMPLHTKMLIGFLVGAVAGICANLYVTNPIGQLFLRLLFMLVVPLVFSALVLGVVEIGDPQSLGPDRRQDPALHPGGDHHRGHHRPGRGQPACSRAAACRPSRPGSCSPASAERAGAIAAQGRRGFSGMDLLLNIVPRNPVAAAVNGDLIAVMFFALMFGIAATVLRSDGTRSFVGAVQGVYDICLKLIGWVIQLAPYAVAALLFSDHRQARLRRAGAAGALVGTVVLALAIHFFVVFPLLVRLSAACRR
jgi:Na+/H+-dicarboxylate symporter